MPRLIVAPARDGSRNDFKSQVPNHKCNSADSAATDSYVRVLARQIHLRNDVADDALVFQNALVTSSLNRRALGRISPAHVGIPRAPGQPERLR
jgi:hypothetical protein